MGDVTYIDPRSEQVMSPNDSLLDVIHCLMITLSEETILLPNTAVAEVIGFLKPEPIEDSPNWFLGRITWRDRLVPLISFGMASISGEVTTERQKGDRIAILNTMNGNAEVPYIGIVSQGIPRLSVLRSEDVTTVEVKPENRLSVAEIVSVEGKSLIIPDIDDLESRLQTIHA